MRRRKMFPDEGYKIMTVEEKKKDMPQADKGMSLLTAINCIVELAEDEGMSEEFMKAVEEYVGVLAKRQGLDDVQAVFFAILVEKSASDNSTEISDLARFLDVNNVKMLRYRHCLDELIKMGLLRKSKNSHFNRVEYNVPSEVIDSLVENRPYKRKSYKSADGIEFFQHFYDITHLRYEEEISTEQMLDEVKRLFQENPDSTFVKAITSKKLKPMDMLVVTHFCRHLVMHGTKSLDSGNFAFLFDEQHERYRFCRTLSEGTHVLMKKKYLEKAFEDGFESESDFCLTEACRKRLLKDFDVKIPENVDNSMLASGKIAHKDLFFCADVQRQIDTFADLISEQHYNDICARLKEKGLRQGFACLFYGAPGTGKTESVLQLARQSGRDIMQVNVSEIKDKWVGESEKNIKAVFDRYRVLVRQSKRAPILLFNEADAIIGKRLTNVSRSVDKMENAMQNIILQEMESLEGIMIATTNLEENMDGAFERRFLYKVRFEKPEAEQRRRIWQSLLPTLKDETAMMLASKYDFSGGQIENIARKCGVESVLYGDEAVTEELIDRFCSEEVISKKGVRIGFCA
jgi:hypothetical protein